MLHIIWTMDLVEFDGHGYLSLSSSDQGTSEIFGKAGWERAGGRTSTVEAGSIDLK